MKTDLNSDLSSYFNEDLENPKYLYLGAAHPIDFETIRKENKDNEAFEMYLTSHYHSAVANAFAQQIAEKNIGREYDMNIYPGRVPILVASDVENLDDDNKAYLYIFPCPDDAVLEKNFIFKVTEPLIPVKVKDLIYKDHKIYYRVHAVNSKSK